MSLWKKCGRGSAYRIDKPAEYKGISLHSTSKVSQYIEKWLIRHNFNHSGLITESFNETDTTYEMEVCGFMVEKYGIRRTIHILDTVSDCKQYLELFDKYYETMRELKEKEDGV